MAGWDGDALAGQLEDAIERQQAAAEARAHKSSATSAERERQSRLESLRLSRARVLEQLTRTTNPNRRTTLEHALQSLDSQLQDS
jgi:predicted metal-dependent hydrolase